MEEPVPGPRVVDVDVPDEAPVTGEELPPPEQPDPGNLPEEPDTGGPVEDPDPGTSPEEEPDPLPDPAECESMPQVTPEALGAWRFMGTMWEEYGQYSSPITCDEPVPDGAGSVVLPLRWSGGAQDLYVGTQDGWNLSGSGTTFTPTSQSGGVLGFSTPADGGLPWMTYLDTTSLEFTTLPAETARVVMTAEDPTGGLRAFLADGTLKAYSATGELRWSLAVSLSAPLKAMGVDAQGQTLLLAAGDTRFGASAVEGVWVDVAGQPGLPFLALGQAPAGTYELVPRAQEGLFLGVTGSAKSWAAAFKSMQRSSRAVPAWLAQDVGRPLLRLPDGTGYLRYSVSGGSNWDCLHAVELIAPSGQSCAQFQLPSQGAPEQVCGPLKLARDGTVTETLYSRSRSDGYYDSEGNRHTRNSSACRVRWWPALIQ
ncbi:hypothetical protein [Corallococcus coralloides]|nr:hypothetical protein [Corallococcus coralloides]